MTAEKLARAILDAIERDELNADANIVLAEQIMPGNFVFHGTATKIMVMPGNFSFHGTTTKVMDMPGDEKNTLYLVAGTQE
jgi:hypothetical protein